MYVCRCKIVWLPLRRSHRRSASNNDDPLSVTDTDRDEQWTAATLTQWLQARQAPHEPINFSAGQHRLAETPTRSTHS